MNIQLIIKALSNETRREILKWLKEPEYHFREQINVAGGVYRSGGVCVSSIKEKSGLTQSVISSYLAMMKEAELLESTRYGKWTYYKRNEKNIYEFIDFLKNEL